MQDLKGKVAFITGGASGIGLAMARAFGREGMSVMIADIEGQALQAAVERLRSEQVRAEGVVADVTRRDSLRAAALETIARFGKVHVVCNNAGVGAGGMLGQVPERDWNWVIDVNLYGVVHGMEIFTPLILSHGEGGHFVNTASMAGMLSGLGFSPYAASKFAVVTMSEGLAMQLKPLGIGVSVLCPGWVRTRINASGRNRPERYGPTRTPDPDSPAAALAAYIDESLRSGLDPAEVAARVLTAIREDELYVFTHPQMRAAMEERFAAISAAMDRAAAR
jgi:NAD(P)-dependent dehydrogenase (short-subunit alcohol dehydrogenase family)